MASAEHFNILQQGVEAWNEWRKNNPKVRPDLREADLRQSSLACINFCEGDLQGVHLETSDLRNADFSNAILREAKFHFADLQHARFKAADLLSAHLTDAELQHACLDSASLDDAILTCANLSHATLVAATLVGACLDSVKFVKAVARSANLTDAELSGADLTCADFRGARLCNARLRAANLAEARLGEANLSGAVLISADLSGSDFTRANLSDARISARLLAANLQEAQLTGARLEYSEMGDTLLGNIDLSEVRGLERVSHKRSSTIGIDTLIRSRGKIPRGFLRGAGLPGHVADYACSFALHAIEFNSCFVSYSAQDDEFAWKVYLDLQHQGVPCWFAPERLKIGAPIRSSLDDAIHLQDKLLVVLSENSVKSAWVEKEVETAFDIECKQDRIVLFPIRLDDAVMDINKGWAADIRRTRHIGDFRGWRNNELYMQAFDRLLRDLKADRRSNIQSM